MVDGWIAFYKGKSVEIPRDDSLPDLWAAKLRAIELLNVPKCARGLLAIAPPYNEQNTENE
jgi:hypothetical protein